MKAIGVMLTIWALAEIVRLVKEHKRNKKFIAEAIAMQEKENHERENRGKMFVVQRKRQV